MIQGKKLLVLGGSPHEISLVRRAQALGAYVIVTDMYDPTTSPAKLVADAYWNVSWTDMDTLVKRCREEKIDGVLAGYSEFRVENQIRLCRLLEFPSYITEEQLEITAHKQKFKEVCRRNGVPTVREYSTVEDVTSFPVIVKPVDRGGSIGVAVANDRDELNACYAYALSMSPSKKVIIEDFITNGEKFDVYYNVQAGEPTLIASSDTVSGKNNGTERVVQSGWLYPSRHLADYRARVEGSVLSMIRDMGIVDGYITFSGFALPRGEFAFFETGFRLTGEHVHSIATMKGFADPQDILIAHALEGDASHIPAGSDMKPQLKVVTVNYHAKGGTLKTISSEASLTDMQDCFFSLYLADEGQECHDDRAILSPIALFSFIHEDPDALAQDVERLHRSFEATNERHEDMIYDRMDASLVPHWWQVD